MDENFLSTLNSNRYPLIGDGAMGTMLHARGVTFETCFDNLNLVNPSLVAEIHREYIDAGAQIIQTNTFGANRYKLSKHNLEGKLSEINIAGVELARRVVLAAFQAGFYCWRCRTFGGQDSSIWTCSTGASPGSIP